MLLFLPCVLQVQSIVDRRWAVCHVGWKFGWTERYNGLTECYVRWVHQDCKPAPEASSKKQSSSRSSDWVCAPSDQRTVLPDWCISVLLPQAVPFQFVCCFADLKAIVFCFDWALNWQCGIEPEECTRTGPSSAARRPVMLLPPCV